MSRTHELKVWPVYWSAIASGVKPFEIRQNDRPYQRGDAVRLREWDPDRAAYTGRVLTAQIGYLAEGGLTPGGLPVGVVVFGLDRVEVVNGARAHSNDTCVDRGVAGVGLRGKVEP